MVVDEAENNDDVHDEMQQHDADEMVEKHNVINGWFKKHQQIDIIDEIEQCEILAQEIDGEDEAVVDDDDGTHETVEIDEIDFIEVQVKIIEWMVEIDEMVEMVEYGENDENDEIIEADMLLEHREIDETDILVEMLVIDHDEEIVCQDDMHEADENELSSDENEVINEDHLINDDNDEVLLTICIDLHYMRAVYTIMLFVRNDETVETVDVLECHLHIHMVDETVEMVETVDVLLYDISEKQKNEQLIQLDDNDELVDLHVEVEIIDAHELHDLLEVINTAKSFNRKHHYGAFLNFVKNNPWL